MITGEVNAMDEIKKDQTYEMPGYVPRPKWQIWLARIAFIAMSAFVVFQVLNMILGWGM